MSNDQPHRPTVASIDLDNLAYNFNSVKKFVGEHIAYMAVVKANAYGHGAVECALRLEREGADWLAVALPEEGVELRDAGVEIPILSFGGFWPGQEEMLLDRDITPVIFGIDAAARLNSAAGKRNLTAEVHVKIDTGMGRVGVPWQDAETFAKGLTSLSNLNVQGLMTHFAAADDLSQNEFTDTQIEKFERVVRGFRNQGFAPDFLDLANSPGAVAHPNSLGNMVRLGGVLYGLGGDVLPAGIEKPDLKPVMSLTTEIAQVKHVTAGESLGYGRTFVTKRNSIIGTIAIGYHDGYRRSLSNSGRVIVNGVFAPVVGRISMDWTIVDLTDVSNTAVGDPVVVIGAAGDLSIRAEDLAALAGTISYEITCGISGRVPRVFKGVPKTD